jgi:hypothetical protein
VIRKKYALHLEGYRPEERELFRELALLRRDFEKLMTLDGDSQELASGLKNYEEYLKEYYDPATVIDECRPYAPSSGRYMIWMNEVGPF